MSKSDVYPPTVWSRFREDAVPVMVLLSLAVSALGLLLEHEAMKKLGLAGAYLVILLVVPALFFEYRADMKFQRENPERFEEEL